MRKVLVIVLIFLGVVLAVETGFLLFVKNQKNTASFNPSSLVVSPTPAPADEKTKMLAHNFEEIYKNITQPQPDVLASSTLTNTYQGKIIKIRRKPGVLENVGFHFDLFIQLQGEKGNTKAMFFTKEQIASMEKQGFSNVSELKVGDTLKVTLTFALLSPDGEKTTKLISSKIVKIN